MALTRPAHLLVHSEAHRSEGASVSGDNLSQQYQEHEEDDQYKIVGPAALYIGTYVRRLLPRHRWSRSVSNRIQGPLSVCSHQEAKLRPAAKPGERARRHVCAVHSRPGLCIDSMNACVCT